MVATSGARLIGEDATEALVGRLFPLATVVTPNIPEACVLSGREIRDAADMLRAAQAIAGLSSAGAVLLKGGHLVQEATDLLWEGGQARWFRGERIENPNTHGTGCTLSSAIACGLAAGRPLGDAVAHAKAYLSGALAAGLDLGRGPGPLDHTYAIPEPPLG